MKYIEIEKYFQVFQFASMYFKFNVLQNIYQSIDKRINLLFDMQSNLFIHLLKIVKLRFVLFKLQVVSRF
ncbi:MAG TPA: hypothetical protein DCY97_01480 [Marinilabiliales bacterium]|nr:hypothetical protein [Marinilabiliales bacterium]